MWPEIWDRGDSYVTVPSHLEERGLGLCPWEPWVSGVTVCCLWCQLVSHGVLMVPSVGDK